MKLSEAQEKSRKTGTEGYLNFRKGVKRLGNVVVWVIFLLYVVLLWPTSQDTQGTDGPNAKTGKTYSQMLLGKERVLCAESLRTQSNPDGCQKLEIIRRNANEIEFHQIGGGGGKAIYVGVWKPETETHSGRYEGDVWMYGKLWGEFGIQMDNHNTGEGWVRPRTRNGYDEKFSIQPRKV